MLYRRGISASFFLSLWFSRSQVVNFLKWKHHYFSPNSSFWTKKGVIWWLFHDDFRAREWEREKKETTNSARRSPEVLKISQIREPKNHVDGVCKCEVLWLNYSWKQLNPAVSRHAGFLEFGGLERSKKIQIHFRRYKHNNYKGWWVMYNPTRKKSVLKKIISAGRACRM